MKENFILEIYVIWRGVFFSNSAIEKKAILYTWVIASEVYILCLFCYLNWNANWDLLSSLLQKYYRKVMTSSIKSLLHYQRPPRLDNNILQSKHRSTPMILAIPSQYSSFQLRINNNRINKKTSFIISHIADVNCPLNFEGPLFLKV